MFVVRLEIVVVAKVAVPLLVILVTPLIWKSPEVRLRLPPDCVRIESPIVLLPVYKGMVLVVPDPEISPVDDAGRFCHVS